MTGTHRSRFERDQMNGGSVEAPLTTEPRISRLGNSTVGNRNLCRSEGVALLHFIFRQLQIMKESGGSSSSQGLECPDVSDTLGNDLEHFPEQSNNDSNVKDEIKSLPDTSFRTYHAHPTGKNVSFAS